MNNKKEKNRIVYSKGEAVFYICTHALMIFFCVLVLLSFLLVVGSSLQTQSEIYRRGYSIIPIKFSLEAYKSIFNSPKVIVNAYAVTAFTTVIGMVLGTLFTGGVAYAMSRKEFKYRKILSLINIFSMLFNGGMVATYIVITRWFNLKNNIWVLILPMIYTPWNVMLMKSFFTSLPNSIVEAARIDGANEYSIFFKFVIPMSKPVFATIALFLSLSLWNDYQTSLLYITNESLYKLQYLLMKILTDMEFLNSTAAENSGIVLEHIDMPTLNLRMAMCVVAAGPMMCIFPFFQKYFTKGVTLGGIKE